jgi:Flp pilus assembly protein TadG
MSRTARSVLLRLRRDERGSVALIVSAAMTLLLGLCAIVIDIGLLIHDQRVLQTSTDAAALSGAQFINCCGDNGAKAINTAIQYSAVAGDLNASGRLTVTMQSGYPLLKCLDSTGISCGSDKANALVVRQQSTVPLFFAQLFGAGTMTLTAEATASARGGTPRPLDAVVILDTTFSMNTNDPNCSNPSLSRIQCALLGVQTLLGVLKPKYDQVALMTFPGLTSPGLAGYDYCDPNGTLTSANIAYYDDSPNYLIVPFSTDYQNPDGSLNSGSALVAATGAAGTGCGGMQAPGGVNTYYADAIAAAQTYLTNNGRTNVQKAIIFISDGDANSQPPHVAPPQTPNECLNGINAAQAAAATGTWIYSISYGSPTSPYPGSCDTDSGDSSISACAAMQQIASDPTKYYSDDQGADLACVSGANSMVDLNQIFGNIGEDLTNARLLPDNTS